MNLWLYFVCTKSCLIEIYCSSEIVCHADAEYSIYCSTRLLKMFCQGGTALTTSDRNNEFSTKRKPVKNGIESSILNVFKRETHYRTKEVSKHLRNCD